MKRKWKDARGETLVEVLASILIGALSVALLFTAVMASGRMDKQAKDMDKAFQKALSAAEAQAVAVTPGVEADGEAIIPGEAEVMVRNIKDPDDDAHKAKPPVNFYGGKGALSYALVTPKSTPVSGP